jgi:PAS domain S-box-containing protein
MLAPILLALAAAPAIVAALATTAIVLAALSGLWNGNFDHAGYWASLGAVAVGASFAVFAARARTRFDRAAQELGVLAAISRIADGSMPLEETIRRFTAELVPAFADVCIVDAVVENELRRLAVRAAGPRREWLEKALAGRRPPPSDAPSGSSRAVARREPQLIARIDDELLRGIAHDDRDLETLREVDPVSVVIVPLIARGRGLGAITMITADSRRRLGEEEFGFLQIVAGRAALALDNAGLFSELSSVERRLDAILANLADAVTVQDESGRLVYANEAAAELLGAASVDELVASSPGELVARFDSHMEDGRRLEVSELPGRKVLRGEEAEPLLVRAIDRQSGEERWRVVKATAVPGVGGSRLAVNIIEDVTETKRAEIAQRLLSEAGQALASSLDYESTLQQVAEMAVPEFADWCSVSIPDDQGFLIQVAVAHSDPERVAFARRLRERYPARIDDEQGLGPVFREGTPQLLDVPDELLRAAARDEEHYELLRGVGMRSAITVPMRVHEQTIGVLSFVTAESGRRFDQADLETAVELARRAAAAVENARLYSERSRAAQTLEAALMPPPLPEIPGWRSATMYRPADPHAEVGGDFFDAFQAGGDWMVVLGDVGGRGVAAASLTSLARYTVRTAGSLTGDPVAALRQLDRWLRERDEMALCTLAAAVLRAGGEAIVVSAGHPPPLIVRGGEVEQVPAGGTLLGAFEDASWEPATISLAPGELLILYTDGVIETGGAGARFGEERLIRALAGADGPHAAVAAVERALREFAGERAEDDAAMVAMMRTAIAVRASSEREARAPAVA